MRTNLIPESLARLLRALTASILLAAVTTAPEATPIQFTIDPTQSTITLSGSIVGSSLSEQGPGSLKTSFSGKIAADLSSAAIQFTGGSVILGDTNGVWSPGPGGSSGSAPADYAGQASTLLGTVKGALRNLLLDLTSASLPIANGRFDASALLFNFPTNSTASFDYDAGFIGHSGIALSGYSTNKIVNGATVSMVGSAQTLSIQIDTEFKFKAVVANDSSVHLTGTILAAQAMGASITSINLNGQTVTIHVAGAAPTASLQISHDLKAWSAQAATRTDDANGAVFTFQASGSTSFYVLSQ